LLNTRQLHTFSGAKNTNQTFQYFHGYFDWFDLFSAAFHKKFP
jgi:hypothetical protein